MITASNVQAANLVKVASGFSMCVNNGVHTIYIVDNATGQTWHSGTGDTMQEAFDNATATLDVAKSPKTPAQKFAQANELALENTRLKEQIASLNNLSDKTPRKIALKD